MIDSIQPLLDDLTWVIVAVLLAPVAIAVSTVIGISLRRGAAIYGVHLIFVLFYAVWVAANKGDALGYYEGYGFNTDGIPVGTTAIAWAVWICRDQFRLSFLGTSVVFGAVGSFGVMLLNRCLLDRLDTSSRWLRLISNLLTFLPSVHFWTSGIGKDGAAFAAAALVTWSSPAIHRRLPAALAGVVLMLAVRPHMSPLLAIQVALAAWSTHRRAWLVCATATAAAVIGSYVAMGYTGRGDIEGSVMRWEEQSTLSNRGTSNFDVTSNSLLIQSFGYLFFPLTGGPSAQWLIASVDDLILLGVCGTGLLGWLRGKRGSYRKLPWTPELWLLASTVAILAPVTSNLGVVVRQRTMVYPAMMSLAVIGIGRTSLGRTGSGLPATKRSRTGGRHAPRKS